MNQAVEDRFEWWLDELDGGCYELGGGFDESGGGCDESGAEDRFELHRDESDGGVESSCAWPIGAAADQWVAEDPPGGHIATAVGRSMLAAALTEGKAREGEGEGNMSLSILIPPTKQQIWNHSIPQTKHRARAISFFKSRREPFYSISPSNQTAHHSTAGSNDGARPKAALVSALQAHKP